MEVDPLELLTVAEVGKLLKLHRTTVYTLINKGQLHAVMLGRYKRIPRAELERFERTLEDGQPG
jgi:excisionase family DNA binding protein